MVTDSEGVVAGLAATIVRNASNAWTLRSVPVGDRIRVSYQPDARRHSAPGLVYDSTNQSSFYEFREGTLPSSARTHNVTAHRADPLERLNDAFPTAGAPDPSKWSSATAVVNSDCGSQSGANSLHFESQQQATTVSMNFAGVSHGEVLLWIRPGDGTGSCHLAENEVQLYLNYSTTGSWPGDCLVEFKNSANTTQNPSCVFTEPLPEGWNYRTYALPLDAYSATLRLRLQMKGADAFDDFAVDDVVVRIRTRWTGEYMYQYDNEGSGETRYVVVMSVGDMTNPSLTRTSIARAHVRIYRYSDTTLFYEADMTKTGIHSTTQRETFTTGNLDWTSFGILQATWAGMDGTIFVAIVDTYDTAGASDSSLGHISRKIGFFQFDPDP